MKRPRVGEHLSTQFIRVFEQQKTTLSPKPAIFAVFHASGGKGTFRGLVTQHEIALHPNWCFADFLKHRMPQPTLTPLHTVRQALSMMKKEKTDVLAVLDIEKNIQGVVTQVNLLQALHQYEHALLLEARAQLVSLRLEKKELQLKIEHMHLHVSELARSDQLTGLPNFPQIRDKIKQLLSQAQQINNQGAILLIDLDNFKDVNDRLGSNCGDRLLQQISERIASSLRNNDTLARKGGDEFIVVLLGVDSEQEAAMMAKNIMHVLTHPFYLDDQEINITASVGISLYSVGTQNVEALLTHADIALREAKHEGKNNYRIFLQSMGDKLQDKQMKEKYLRHALSNNELFIRYQPFVETKNNNIIGMEALLRWQNPELGLILPAEFIPLAEKMGLIMPISEWVLRTACTQIMEWQKNGRYLRIAVNLSARQFRSFRSANAYQLINSITTVLDETKLPPDRLEIEITENFLMKNYSMTMSTLKILKNLGVRISCDDFGTGYSSLNYLKLFPIDTIKIDKSFINDIAYDPVDVAIIRAIIIMAQQLGIEVIAEGVENKAQLSILRELGCNIIQGYYFSKPLSAEAANLILDNPLKL